ncbi:MAG TPA: UDP-N-acetylglucosamine 2-epimerase (non-hydrolyzing) [Acidimicrobiales bacterium]|nr:UDP-N-acetylglucosamine 2-epimerase (non-hydrolyzing) [Acidimicrobiales bacterium]
MSPTSPTVLIVAGTRPEAIKVAPVVHQLRSPGSPLGAHLLATGQHPDLAAEALADLDLVADTTLALHPSDRSSQAALLAALLPALSAQIEARRPAAVLVQGDTASAFAGGLAALWAQVPLVHLEAGLRSGDLAHPFPEEAYRRQLGAIASLHLAPTPRAVANLRAEAVAADAIALTGNTVVDAARMVAANQPGPGLAPTPGRRRVLLTTHRRESWGQPLHDVLDAAAELVATVPDVELLVPVHPNPNVGREVRNRLGGVERVVLTEPLSYRDLVAVLATATLVLTDSGGIQEEAPSFGVPVLVLREVTERPEAVEAGCARLVGTDRARVLAEARTLLTDPVAWQAMARVANPFGDGRAAERSVGAMAALLLGHPAPEPWASRPLVRAAGGPG